MNTTTQFNQILNSFNIKAVCLSSNQIDNYKFFDLKLNPGAKVKDIQKYSDELSLALKASCKPSFKILHDQGIIRMELISPSSSKLNLFDYFTNDDVPDGELNCLLGKTVDGKRLWMDLMQNPHMLVSGTTGSGKSTLLHNIIANILNYNDAQLFLIDPKRIEFSDYTKIKSIQLYHSYDDALQVIGNIISIMENRYKSDAALHSVYKPIVIIIDEFADLIMQDKDDEFYIKICRLAQKCRAAKISIILSTQRPSVNVINGTIKANFPARIACRVASKVDSKVIMDTCGAENLLGKGDALLKDNFYHMERFQIAYTNAQEVCEVFGD